MKRLISGMSLAAALTGVLTVTDAPMATGALTVAPVALTSSATVPATAKSSAMRGTVVNKTDLTIKVSINWCKSKKAPCGESDIKELKPHESTDSWGKDIDGYEVPPGYKFEVEYEKGGVKSNESEDAGWHKIRSYTVARIKKATH